MTNGGFEDGNTTVSEFKLVAFPPEVPRTGNIKIKKMNYRMIVSIARGKRL